MVRACGCSSAVEFRESPLPQQSAASFLTENQGLPRTGPDPVLSLRLQPGASVTSQAGTFPAAAAVLWPVTAPRSLASRFHLDLVQRLRSQPRLPVSPSGGPFTESGGKRQSPGIARPPSPRGSAVPGVLPEGSPPSCIPHPKSGPGTLGKLACLSWLLSWVQPESAEVGGCAGADLARPGVAGQELMTRVSLPHLC